jgi:hypothetical protein
MDNKNNFFTLIKLAEFIGVPFYKIRYALSVGHIPKPSANLNGRPIFSLDEAVKIKNFFEN